MKSTALRNHFAAFSVRGLEGRSIHRWRIGILRQWAVRHQPSRQVAPCKKQPGRECGQKASGGTGTGSFLGGTGKYARMKGKFEIVRKVGPRDEPNRAWTDYVTVTRSWELP